MYHKIDSRMEVGINALSPREFQEQMNYLHQEGYQTITFRDLLFAADIPEKTVIITFDDAYESVYKNALPVMERYGQRGVVYVHWCVIFMGVVFASVVVSSHAALSDLGEAGCGVIFDSASHFSAQHAVVYDRAQVMAFFIRVWLGVFKLLVAGILSSSG